MIWFQYDDGGRKAAGFKGTAGDCVTRALAIATGSDYRKIYEWIRNRQKAKVRALEFSDRVSSEARERYIKRELRGVSPRNGCSERIYGEWLRDRGFRKSKKDAGCRVSQVPREIDETLIVRCKRKGRRGSHLVAIVNNEIRDTFHCGGFVVLDVWRKRSRASKVKA